MSWSRLADRRLAELFHVGQPAPTKEELHDAYPFGPRQYWPYKVWLKRVRAWKAAHAKAMARPTELQGARTRAAKVERSDRESGELFG